MKLIPHKSNLCSKFAEKMISVKICDKCNGHCYFCVDKGGYKINATNPQKIIESAVSLPEYKTVIITGGEPFLVFDDVITVLEGLREHKTRLVLNTNGSLLTFEKIKQLNGVLDELQISIHNFDENKNSQIFGIPISFEKIKNLICKTEFLVAINSTFNSSYETEEEKQVMYSEMVHLAQYLGAKKLRLTELKKINNPLLAKDFYLGEKDDKYLITNGCTEYRSLNNIDISIKRLCKYAKGENATAFSCCFIDVAGQQKIEVDTIDTFKVIYGDGLTTNDWIFATSRKQLSIEVTPTPAQEAR